MTKTEMGEPEVPAESAPPVAEHGQYIPGGKQWTTLFIRNVPWKARPDEIRGLFAVYGTVKSVRIPTHPDGVNRGYGFVDMEKKEDAEKAIAALSGKPFKDRYLIITESTHTYGENVPKPGEPKRESRSRDERKFPPRYPEHDRRDHGPRYPEYERYPRLERDPYERDRMYMPPPDYHRRPVSNFDRYEYDMPPPHYYRRPMYPEDYERRYELPPPPDRMYPRDRYDEYRY